MNPRYYCLALSCFGLACGQRANTEQPVADTALVSAYCGSCHLAPAPDLLDKTTWKRVLPLMGLRRCATPSLQPTGQALELAEWVESHAGQPTPDACQRIWKHYLTRAPDTLTLVKALPRADLSALFAPLPLQPPNASPAATTVVRMDTLVHSLLVANAQLRTLEEYAPTGNLRRSTPVGSVISFADWTNAQGIVLTQIGFSINPSPSKAGYVTSQSRGTSDKKLLLSSLHRPVQTLIRDLDGDGTAELLVCSYGVLTGSLAYWKRQPDGTYHETVLKAAAGARQAVVQDFTNDGLPDILALFAQGNEQLVLFKNRGQGHFTEQILLRFPPVYGSTYVEVADFNHDHRPDLLYVCGDNADYSLVEKPYHGLYLFMNQGDNQFKQTHFLSLPGATQALARDFDHDGDLDIAAIAFFAPQPSGGFTYWQNKGTSFRAFTLPIGHLGRWLTLDAGDVDGDGDVDLALGNYSLAPPFGLADPNWTRAAGALLLKNRTIQATLRPKSYRGHSRE